jgi:hypothetical protein
VANETKLQKLLSRVKCCNNILVIVGEDFFFQCKPELEQPQ